MNMRVLHTHCEYYVSYIATGISTTFPAHCYCYDKQDNLAIAIEP